MLETLALQQTRTLMEMLQSIGSGTGTSGVGGGMVLLMDPQLSGAVSLSADAVTLRSAGVERVVNIQDPIELSSLQAFTPVFVVRPVVDLSRRIAQLLADSQNPPVAHVLFVPRRSLICERVFAEASVMHRLAFAELHLDLIVLDSDVLSLELHDSSFRDLYLNKDPSLLYSTSKALMKVQALHGIIPKILTKGPNAHALATLMLRMRKELDISAAVSSDSNFTISASAAAAVSPTADFSTASTLSHQPTPSSPFRVFPPKCDIDSIIILDRSVDFVTPLCMELTYEGLIDEFFGIKTTFVQVNEAYILAPQSLQPNSNAPQKQPPVHPASGTARTKKVALNASTDKLYSQLRDLNFAMVASVISQTARKIQEDVDGRRDAKTISQIKDFIGKIGGIEGEKAYLKLHTSIAEEISKNTQDPAFKKFLELQQNILSGNMMTSQTDYIEELIDKQAPISQTLRLMCLYSVVCGGFKPKIFEFLKREFVQTYGIEHLQTLENLQRASLLFPTPGTGGAFEGSIAGGVVGASNAGKASFSAIRKPLQVIVDDIDEAKPTDIAYVYSGYAPVSVRLIEAATSTGRFFSKPLGAASSIGSLAGAGVGLGGAAMGKTGGLIGSTGNQNASVAGGSSPSVGPGKKGGKARDKLGGGVSWEGLEEILNAVPGGSTAEFEQVLPDPHFVTRNDSGKKVTLVLFLGGCTSTEISSLRFLSRGKGRQFLTMTTSTITGNRMIDSLVEVFEKGRAE
ncbi:hypothetical protein HDU81_010374 [Chytriomyces hyalinus]|nr:hypothetical protein HDU81_010374 [Chytriomyces hyalinus]